MHRADLIDLLRDHLVADPRVRVAWLGGSDATGRTDGLSDLDPVVVAESVDIEGVFSGIEDLLDRTIGIRHRHRFGPPTPHGHEQALYLGERTPPSLAIDLVIMDVDTETRERFIEPERHGHPIILVDRAGWFDQPTPLDRASHQVRIDRHLSELTSLHPHLMPLVEKAIQRGDWLDAITRYQNRCVKPLCDLMRIEHDPDRFDFGFRYLDRDLPDAERELLQRLAFVGSPEDLPAAFAEARREIERRLESFAPRRTRRGTEGHGDLEDVHA